MTSNPHYIAIFPEVDTDPDDEFEDFLHFALDEAVGTGESFEAILEAADVD